MIMRSLNANLVGLSLATALLVGTQVRCMAQTCSDYSVQFSDLQPKTRSEMVLDLARVLKTSVVAELVYVPDAPSIVPPAGSITVAEFTKLLGFGSSLQCDADKKLIHIYDPSAVSAKTNALNYKFERFAVPEVADLFIIRLRVRLLTDAFRSKELGPSSGSDTGAISNDAATYRLTPETLKDMTARDILLREASELPMVFAVEIRTKWSTSDEEAWRQSDASLQFVVLR